jgi:flavin reductase (DIM6/NTAB) family NADH-FMN oxidoreductase RutF
MAKLEVSLTAYAEETMNVLGSCGCLLVSGNAEKANVMTIGWGLIGRLWSKPFFMVAVRPSRYTYEFLEKTDDFTVNVPRKGMEEIVDFCGSVSGREHDKFKEKGLVLTPSRKVNSPIISNCIIHYECKVSYKTRVIQSRLPRDILKSSYPSRNFHTLYFGEILATYADEYIKDNLPI